MVEDVEARDVAGAGAGVACDETSDVDDAGDEAHCEGAAGGDGETSPATGDRDPAVTGLVETVVSGADIVGVKKGFRRSTETVQGLFERDKTNVFSFLSSTKNGPT